MAFLRLLLSAGLIFAAATALPVDGHSENGSSKAADYRLPDNVVPIHYNVKIIPYLEEDNFTFDGEIAARIEIRRATQKFELHALNLTIDEAATSLLDSDGIARTPTMHDYNNLTEILIVNFDDELPSGIYVLNMKFTGNLSDDLHGLFKVSYVNEEGNTVWLAVTHFEATWARRAFPCWDEPALKATFNISIKHHRSYTAISNMPIREQTNEGEGGTMVWTHFRTTPVMSTYLVAFVVSDYVRVPNADGTINMWTRSELAPYSKFAQDVAEKAGQLLTWYTNCTDRVPKMDHVAVPKFSAGAMENWGLIIYVEHEFIYNEELHTMEQKETVAKTVTHEMAHQWFGNVVSPLWWSHIWLNEGFASFFETYITDQIFKDWRLMETFVTDIQMYSLRKDVAKMEPIIPLKVNDRQEISSLSVISNYRKAPAILRMLQHIITAEVFRNGLVRYLNTHQLSSASTDDLWNALQAALDESDVPHNKYRLKEVMDTWITQRHFPVVRVTRNYDTGETILTQEHFRLFSDDRHIADNKWWIPVTFTTQTNPDFTNTVPTHWLTPDQNITIEGIDPDNWIIVNLQETGYYRVNYDTQNWRKIASYLKSDNYTNIHVINRAQIIDDAYHLMVARQLDVLTFLDLVSYLSQETDFIPWKPMFDILEHTENFYKYPGNAFLKPRILELLHKLVENVGYEEDPNEDTLTKLKRKHALKWACIFGHSECKSMATIKLSRHLEDPETHKVPPNLKDWTFCNGIMQANASIWNKLFDKYMEEQDTNILGNLACSEDPHILINYLKIFCSNNTSILNSDPFYSIYYPILDRCADDELLLGYMLENINEIISRSDDKASAFDSIIRNIISSVFSDDKLDKINNFAKANFSDKKWIQDEVKEYKAILSDKFAAFRPYILESYEKYV